MMFALAISVSAQKVTTYAIVNGKVVEKTNATTVKVPDTCIYTSTTGVKFYRGSKGGVYYYKISKKTGKPYKAYVK